MSCVKCPDVPSLPANFTYIPLLAGFILLMYGLVVYTLVSVMLVDQIDISLTNTAQELITNTRMNSLGEIEIIRVFRPWMPHPPSICRSGTTKGD